MNLKKLLVLPLAVIPILVTIFTGCSGDLVTISLAGSTTVTPVADVLAESYMAAHRNVEVTVSGGGSGVGVTSAHEGTVDIGMASRDLKATEPDLTKHLLARDGIAIVTHTGNTAVTGLTIEQVRNIYNGTITNCSEVGGTSATITVVSREEGSGTRDAFEELVMDDSLIAETAILQPSNGSVRTAVAGNVNSIGFLSFGYLDTTVKTLAINGVAGTAANAKSGTYPVVRPLYFLTNGTPTGEVKKFIDYCRSEEGQAIVEQQGFLSVL